jgi:hypothetical protein
MLRWLTHSFSIPGNAVHAVEIGAKCEVGILHITLPEWENRLPKTAQKMNIESSFSRIICSAFCFNLSVFDRFKNLML